MEKNNKVQQHYDGSADNYHLQYERDLLHDVTRDYPANYFRMRLMVNSFIRNQTKRLIEVGVGEGTPLATLGLAGFEVAGFDISNKMVAKTKENFRKHNLDVSNIIWADIEDPITYSPLLRDGQFDGLMAMGVMPHVRNDEFVLSNIKEMVRPGGTVFIEFRNKLFSMFTFNRHTLEFILDDLLKDVDSSLKSIVQENLKLRLEMDQPKLRIHGESANLKKPISDETIPGYDSILSKFHNPFEVVELFKKLDFKDINLLWYHYHPAMPFLEKDNEVIFRDEALKLEHENSGWKGLFLSSAFVVEAKKSD